MSRNIQDDKTGLLLAPDIAAPFSFYPIRSTPFHADHFFQVDA